VHHLETTTEWAEEGDEEHAGEDRDRESNVGAPRGAYLSLTLARC
jgi:hypothetical protein